MQTQQLIRASADVVTITSFRPGDVYKRVESGSFSDPSLRFGVVESVMNNGEDSAFTATEYRPDYTANIIAEQKVYDGTRPAALFAATPEEISKHIEGLVEASERRIREAAEALDKARQAHGRVLVVRNQVLEGALSAPAVQHGVIEAAEDDQPAEPTDDPMAHDE